MSRLLEKSSGPDSPPGLTISELLDSVQVQLSSLRSFLHDQVLAFEPEIRPLVAYALGHSGKMLRPLLVFSAAWRGRDRPEPSVERVAAVVELVHLATLVHDDILDDADMRRNSETVTAKYGSHAAVLLGDALFAHALKLASDFPTPEVCRVVSEATRQVCTGEIAQTFARRDVDLSTERYFRMVDLKTAELFAASARLGVALRTEDPALVDALSTCARHLGIAYQVFDDVNDLFGREDRSGKTLGTDLASGKFTLPVIYWLESLNAEERRSFSARLIEGGLELAKLRTLLQESGALEKVKLRFREELVSASRSVGDYLGDPGVQRVLYLSGALETLTGQIGLAWQ